MLQELRFAFRMLLKQPGFSLIATLTLALGIGATSAVFSLIQAVLLTPPPYQKPEQLVLIPTARTDGQKMDSPRGWPATMEIEGQPPVVKESDKIALPMRAATPDYFKLMGMALTDGREFRSTDDDKAPNVAIVNREFADRYFPHSNAIGRKVWFNGRDKPGIEIVGEIANGRTDDLTQEASPELYLPLWQANAFSKHLVVRTTADPRSVVVAVERELHSVDPTAAIENVKTLEQIRDESLASRTFAMNLLTGFSVVGSVLTLVGIYGVLSLSVASRRRELAIRSAVGAQQSDIPS